MKVLEIKDCAVGYGKPILKNISFSTYQGDIVNIYGENGVGKTTFLKAFLGVSMLEGEIKVCSRNILDLTPIEKVRYVSIAFAEVIKSDITVKRYFEISPSPIWQDLIDIFEVGKILEKPIREISSGQNRKVQLIRALSSPAPVIALDEPFAHLDEPSKYRLKEIIISLTQKGRTFVITSHKPLDFGNPFKLPPSSQ